jgi:hypothetical protein
MLASGLCPSVLSDFDDGDRWLQKGLQWSVFLCFIFTFVLIFMGVLEGEGRHYEAQCLFVERRLEEMMTWNLSSSTFLSRYPESTLNIINSKICIKFVIFVHNMTKLS